MAYSQTLHLVDAEYEADSVADFKLEEETRLVQRKMTVDFGVAIKQEKVSNDTKKFKQFGISQDLAEEVGS